jgi:hypothetical protein
VPEPETSGDDVNPRAVHPLDDVRLAVLFVDHGGVVRADDLVLVQLLDGVQVRERLRNVRVCRGV